MTLRGDCDACDRTDVELRHADAESFDKLLLDKDGVVAVCGACIVKQSKREHAESLEEKRQREY